MTRLLTAALAAALIAGCGTKPLAPPDPLKVREPGRQVQMRDPRTGLRFTAPLNWVKRIRANPGIFRIASGAAEVSGWAYPRAERLPQTHAELAKARDALVAEAKQRGGAFQLTSSAITKVKGWPAIELRGTQRILGRRVETRSVHVFRAGEYVFEALAPAATFTIADQKVLAPLLRSLVFRPL
jgi:predicted small lipoprotein YifL